MSFGFFDPASGACYPYGLPNGVRPEGAIPMYVPTEDEARRIRFELAETRSDGSEP